MKDDAILVIICVFVFAVIISFFIGLNACRC